jgi:hypothetical protein
VLHLRRTSNVASPDPYASLGGRITPPPPPSERRRYALVQNQVTSWGSFDAVPPPFSLLALPYRVLEWCWACASASAYCPWVAPGFERLDEDSVALPGDVVPEKLGSRS